MNSNSSTPIKAGIVGLGMAGAGIVNSLARLPMVQLAAAADLRENALAAFRDQFHGRIYQSFEGLCEDPNVDAVWVATPSPMHCEHAIALAEHGKHAIVEKPMATSLDECQRMIDAAERNNVVLIAGGARSFEPAFVEMQRILASGRLGKLGALATWEFTPWGETPQRLSASAAAYDYRRRLRAHEADEYESRETLRFGGRPVGGGFFGGAEAGWAPQDAGIVIASCERGEIRQSATGLYVYDDDGRHDEPLPPGSSMRLNEVTDLLDGIAGRRKPLHDGRWGMATMEVVLGLMQSAAEHREIVMEHQVPVHGLG